MDQETESGRGQRLPQPPSLRLRGRGSTPTSASSAAAADTSAAAPERWAAASSSSWAFLFSSSNRWLRWGHGCCPAPPSLTRPPIPVLPQLLPPGCRRKKPLAQSCGPSAQTASAERCLTSSALPPPASLQQRGTDGQGQGRAKGRADQGYPMFFQAHLLQQLLCCCPGVHDLLGQALWFLMGNKGDLSPLLWLSPTCLREASLDLTFTSCAALPARRAQASFRASALALPLSGPALPEYLWCYAGRSS